MSLALADLLANPPGNNQGRNANHRCRVDVILDNLEQKDRDALIRALADPVGWPHTTLAKTVADVLGESCSYETVRKYRMREGWKQRDDCPKDMR